MIKKKIIAIIIGATNLPRISPNLIQAKLRGPNIFEFNIPRNKKINETINDQILIVCPSIIGQTDINKKTIKNMIPKLLFELISLINHLIPD